MLGAFRYLEKGEKSDADADFVQAEKLGYKAKPNRPSGALAGTPRMSRALCLASSGPRPIRCSDCFLVALAFAQVPASESVAEWWSSTTAA